MWLKLQPVSRTSPPYTMRATTLLRNTDATPPEYLSPDQANKRLKGRKNQPNAFSIERANQSLGAPCSLSNTAQSAGERVSELIAEMTVEIAMVIANCL